MQYNILIWGQIQYQRRTIGQVAKVENQENEGKEWHQVQAVPQREQGEVQLQQGRRPVRGNAQVAEERAEEGGEHEEVRPVGRDWVEGLHSAQECEGLHEIETGRGGAKEAPVVVLLGLWGYQVKLKPLEEIWSFWCNSWYLLWY